MFLCNAGLAHLSSGRYGGTQPAPTGESQYAGAQKSDPTPAFTPKKNYVMITFDDSYGRSNDKGSAFQQVQQLLDAGALMTYFATAAFTGDFSTFDDWFNKYNCEVANHTVTHIRGGGDVSVAPVDIPDNWDKVKIAYTTNRWKNEMKDMDSILKLWSNIDSEKITGFRAPQLLLNVYAFDGFAAYIKEKGSLNNNYYDSTITYGKSAEPVTIGSLEPPKELTIKNYCNNAKFNFNHTYLGADHSQCTTLMSYYGKDKYIKEPIWEIPIPILPGSKLAMTLPECSDTNNCTTPDKFKKFISDWLSSKSKTPLLISIHSDELELPTRKWFVPWVKEHTKNLDINFVTVQSVIDKYAGKKDHILETQQASLSQTYESGDDSSPNNCPVGDTGYASSSPDGSSFGVYPYCDFDCSDAESYGKNCYKHDNTPGKTEKFITYNAFCVPQNIPADFSSGAYPWLGNPMGNSTVGTTCNYFPKVTAPAPISTDCANNKPYPKWPDEKSDYKLNYCVIEDGLTYRCTATTDFEVFCKNDEPGTAKAGIYWVEKK